jgi:hypothetical protein
MTRAHAARQLLALGPLSFRDFHAITGWPYAVARSVISYLQDAGYIVNECGAWRLA